METKKIDFTKSLLDFDGKEVIDNNAPMTFKGIVSRILAMCKADDKVMERWELAQRIYKSEGEMEITPSQILLVKNAETEMFTFSVYEQTKMSKVERAFMLNNVSENIDARSIVKDFLTFVEEDVKAN